MTLAYPSTRFVALALIVVLAVTLAVPRQVEALEPLTIVAIASLAVLGLIIVVYLVIANASGSHRQAGEPRYVTCVESDLESRNCWAVPEAPSIAPAINNSQSP